MPSKGSIHKKGNGYRAVVYFQDRLGKSRRKEITRKTEADAKAALKEWKENFKPLPKGAELTVTRMCELAIESRIERQRAPETIRNYQYYLREYIRPNIGHKRVINLTTDDVEILLQEIAKRAKGKSYIQLQILVRNFLRMAINKVAMKKQIVLVNVAALAEPPTYKRATPDNRLSPETFSDVMAWVQDPTAYAYFLFLAETGFRPSEALHLKRRELRNEKDGLWVQLEESKTEEGKKRVPVSLVAANAIKSILSDSLFVFAGPTGKPPNPKTMRDRWHEANTLAALDAIENGYELPLVKLYSLRKFFGTVMARNEKEAVLKRLMRHTDIRTTMKYYVDAIDHDLRIAVERKQP